MGMSNSVIGIRKPDEQWLKYKKIVDTLIASGFTWEDAPGEVQEFFGWEEPDKDGIIVDLKNHECCKNHNADMEDGFVIEIAKLPKNITHIKFINSY